MPAYRITSLRLQARPFPLVIPFRLFCEEQVIQGKGILYRRSFNSSLRNSRLQFCPVGQSVRLSLFNPSRRSVFPASICYHSRIILSGDSGFCKFMNSDGRSRWKWNITDCGCASTDEHVGSSVFDGGSKGSLVLCTWQLRGGDLGAGMKRAVKIGGPFWLGVCR